MNPFLAQALLFHPLFLALAKPLQLNALLLTKKLLAKRHLSFENFLLDHYLLPKLEYVPKDKVQRVLQAKILIDLHEITNTLASGQPFSNFRQIKRFYALYPIEHPLLRLWYLWALLKQKLLKLKPYKTLLRFYKSSILPELPNFQNTLLALKFEIFHTLLTYLVGDEQLATHQLVALKHNFVTLYDLKAFFTDLHLIKYEGITTTVQVNSNLLSLLQPLRAMPVEDFLQYIYLQIKLLYPISKSVAPSLAESMFNELQILTLCSSAIYNKTEPNQRKFTQIQDLLNKYYNKVGVALFQRRTFQFAAPSHRKNVKSLINLTVDDQTTLFPQSTKVRTQHNSIMSLYDPTMIQQIQQDLTKTKPSSTTHSKAPSKLASTHYSRGTSISRNPSQFFSPEHVLNKDILLEIDNYQMRNISKRKTAAKVTVNQIYQNLIKQVRRSPVQDELQNKITEQQQETQTQEDRQEILNTPYISPAQTGRVYCNKYTFLQILVAYNIKIFHLDMPGSKRLPKLIAKHFLSLLDYVDDPPFIPQSERITKIQQIMRKTKRKSTNMRMQQQFLVLPKSGIKAKFVNVKAYFSEGVKKTVNRIRTLMKMGFFRRRKPILDRSGALLGAVAPKQHSLQNYLDSARLKTVPDTHQPTSDDKQFQSLPTPRHHEQTKANNSSGFGFFKTIALAKRLTVQLLNKDEVNYLQEKYGTLEQVKSSHFYYPSIKYLIITHGKIEVWKLKYRDLTHDKNFMVICSQKEDIDHSFYRFDLPVVKKGKQKNGITIWPTVQEALEEFDKQNRFSKVFQFNMSCQIKKHSQPQFLIGLTQRARGKVTHEDILSAGHIQSYFYNFHRSQIVKIKKIKGFSSDILPIIKTVPPKLIDLLKINEVTSSEEYIRRRNRTINIQNYIHQTKIPLLSSKPNYELLNNILQFRFLCASREFMVSGGLMTNLKDLSVRLHSGVIRIKSDQYSVDFLAQNSRYILLTIEVKVCKDLLFDCSELLSPSSPAKVQPLFGEHIDKRFFEIQISALTFNKEVVGGQKVQKLEIQPLQLNIQLYHQLLNIIENGSKVVEQLKFEKLLDHIIYQREFTVGQKQALTQFINEVFEVNIKDQKIQLKHDYSYMKTKKVSIKFMQAQEIKSNAYAISPIEKHFIKNVSLVKNIKDQILDQMFKLEITQNIQHYEDIYSGKQTIEEPDFMNNNQEILTADEPIQQIKIYRMMVNGVQLIRANLIKKANKELSYRLNLFLNAAVQKKIFHRQSYYVNHQLPSSIIMKIMILNKSKELLNYFNCNSYRFILNRQTQYLVEVNFYYTFNRNLEMQMELHKLHQRIYYFDGNMLFLNIQVDCLQSKCKAIKMIFSYYDLQDLFRVNIPQYGNLYCFDDKFVLSLAHLILRNTYAERKFLYALPTFLNRTMMHHKNSRQKFINYHKSISIQSESHSPRSPSIGSLVQINDLNLLERHSNCKFVVLFYDTKEQISKYYCETYLKETRVIGHFVKKFRINVVDGKLISLRQGVVEYAVITIFCHLILDVWIVEIYFPKSSRYLFGSINLLDLAEMESHDMFGNLHSYYKVVKKSKFVRQETQNRLILHKQRTYNNLTKFFEFTRDISNDLNRKLVNHFIFSKREEKKLQIEQQIWQRIVEAMRLNKKAPYDVRLESELQNRSYIEKSLIEQLEHDTNVNSRAYTVIGESLIQRKKNESVENQEQLIYLKKLSKMYLDFLKDKQIIMIKSTHQNSSQICINLGFTSNLREFIHKLQIKIDKVGLYSVLFFLEYAEENTNQDNPFLPFESIKYSNSSSFNLAIKIFGFQTETPIYYADKQINVREVLNLFIADGYFKYQTNYMNAKLSLSDLKQICEYVGFKIKTSNFLGLANQQRYYNNHPFFLEDRQGNKDYDGEVYTEYKRSHLVQIQLFIAHSKVHISRTSIKGHVTFEQKKLYFHQVDDICPYFSQLIGAGLTYHGLQKLMKIL